MTLRKITAIILVMMALLPGCAAILEGDTIYVTPHSGFQNISPPVERMVASNYDELKESMLDFIMQHRASDLILIYTYDGDVSADVDRASNEIKNYDPVGVYAVSELICTVTRIVALYEVEVNVEYRRTHRQVSSITAVASEQELNEQLLRAMSAYRNEMLIRTSINMMPEDILNAVSETYYLNPRNILMMPSVAVETFPEIGVDRIFEFSFGYIPQTNILRQNTESLSRSVRFHASLAVGESEEEITLSLVENLIAGCDFNEGMARTISEHGVQNFAATAYGALENANAVGEGFAMAFKALCDELGIFNRVVLGRLGGMIHAWNIVLLAGDYYHIDVSMCAVNGMETAFLKTDADFMELYAWDIENTIACAGPLTYYDVRNAMTPSVENGMSDEVE